MHHVPLLYIELAKYIPLLRQLIVIDYTRAVNTIPLLKLPPIPSSLDAFIARYPISGTRGYDALRAGKYNLEQFNQEYSATRAFVVGSVLPALPPLWKFISGILQSCVLNYGQEPERPVRLISRFGDLSLIIPQGQPSQLRRRGTEMYEV